MKNRTAKYFSCFFVLVIASVPVIQGISELKTRKSIQFLDIFEDTFISPIKSGKDISKAFKELRNEINKAILILNDSTALDNGTESLISHLEEAQSISENIKRKTISVNRHISDTSDALTTFADSLGKQIHLQLESAYDNPASIKNNLTAIDSSILQVVQPLENNNLFKTIKTSFFHFFKYTVFNRHYLRKYEKEMENSSIFANSIRPVIQFINYAFFNNPGDKAVLGSNGWMFYKPDIEYLYKPSVTDSRSKVVDYNSKPLQDDPIEVISDFKKQLDGMGIELLIMIVPGKPSIYPDLLNPDIRNPDPQSLSHSLQIMQILNSRGINVVNLFDPFLEARKQDSVYGDSLYLQTDTHWKNRGPRIAASVTADVIKQMPWFNEKIYSTEYVIDTVEVFRNGDIGVMTKLPEFKIRALQLNLPLEKTKCHQVYSVTRDDSGQILSKELYRDDYRKSRILILGDSFSRIYQTDEPRSAGWISHLAFELSEPMASIVSDGGASTIVRETLARKASLLKGKKLVIWEFVERDLRFGAEGWKQITIPLSASQK